MGSGAALHRLSTFRERALSTAVVMVAGPVDHADEHPGLSDVKPGNILIEHRDDGPWAYLQDFSLTYAGISYEPPGALVGSRDYIAPEVVRGEPADPRSDVWSLGVSLFEMLTGRPPFAERNGMRVLRAILADPAPRVTMLAPDVPAAFDPVVERAMAKDMDARFQSAGALGDAAVEAASSTKPETARQPSHRHESRKPASVPDSDEERTRDIVGASDAKLRVGKTEGRARSNIFLCYRRDDSRWAAGRLADALRDRFGADSVFVDVDRARVGNWRQRVDQALAESAAVVVLIGSSWLREIKKRSAMEDEVRYEIAAALRRGTIIVPVTVGRTRVPHRSALPPDIALLADQQVYQLGEGSLWRPIIEIHLSDLATALRL
jgi:hypothetical protein